MKRRILCLVLCLLAVLPLMASCGKKEEEDTTVEQSSREAVTLSMYVITENETKPDAAQAVEDAINKLLKSKYTTRVKMTFLTADKYYSAVEESIKNMKSASSATKTEETGTDTAVVTDETIVNEYGVKELKYPDLTPSQIDIIMIDNYDKYAEYVSNGWLYRLTDAVTTTSKKLGDYIYPSILNAAYINDSIYAVPNNKPIGECKYLIVDKELASEYGLDSSKMNSLSDLLGFYAWVKENKASVTPIAGNIDMNVSYLNVDAAKREFTDTFSLVGSMNVSEKSAESLLADEKYINELLSLAKCRYEGYFGAENAAEFASAIKEGDAFSMAEYSDKYEIVALAGSTETKEELCSDMFAITNFVDKTTFTRAMEVITYLNTNSELRNLLQYGVENVNYELDLETGALRRLNRDYMMDLYKTGNVYMAYPEEGMSLDIWELSKKQNLVSGEYGGNPFGGFAIPADTPASDEGEGFTVNFDSSKALADASKELANALASCATYDDYEALVKGAAEKYADVVNAFLSTSDASTPYALYAVANAN